MVKIPELLAPAGSRKNMRFAFAYGADAVYAGQPRYSLRVRNNEFSKHEVIADAIAEAHALGKKFYLASNINPHNAKIKTYLRDLEPVIDMNPDALIMSDPGLIMMVRDRWPDMPVHLSVQANAVNYASVEFWRRMGLSRVILSRELSLEEIAEIKANVPEMELEVFVHGALCIAYSGRCLLSGYMSHRDPNQGTCTNTCRWKYDVHQTDTDDSGDLVKVAAANAEATSQANAELWSPGNAASDLDEVAPVLLEEETRPGELMPAYEDEHGTYIMNSKDLRAVQHVEALTKMGMDSLKIEGRTKTYFYVARTTQAYRKAIDDAVAGRPFDMRLMDELESLANRGYTEGFYRRHLPEEYQNYEKGASTPTRQQYVGDISAHTDGSITIAVKNKFCVGDTVELMTPAGNHRFTVDAMTNTKGETITDAKGSGHVVTIPFSDDAQIDEYSLLLRDLPK